MRKQDYLTLADTIRAAYAAGGQSANPADWRLGYQTACEAIARKFAASANVKTREFLKACGIE